MGALVIPGIAFTALLIAPFLDTGNDRRPAKRPIATGMMLMGLVSVTFLTWESVITHDWAAAAEQGKIQETPTADIDENDPGYQVFQAQSCVNCHGDALQGVPNVGPSLIGTGLAPEEIADIAQNGVGSMPAGQFQGSDEELRASLLNLFPLWNQNKKTHL